MFYQFFLKPILFVIPAERAHYIAMRLFSFVTSIPGLRTIIRYTFNSESKTTVEVAGMRFKNRVGLAAGFDKNGVFLNALSRLPFGHIEVGTITPRAQSGNPQPRLFRLPADDALINRMGFNNDGVQSLVNQLRKFKNRNDVIIGGNIGKNKDTALDRAADDYVYCFEMLFDYVDYFTVNVSSPNTPGLRSLQEREPLEFLLGTLDLANGMKDRRKPIFLKIAPDLSFEQIDEIIDICKSTNVDGIIASNTTIDRSNLNTSLAKVEEIGKGGLSGKPLSDRSTSIVSHIRNQMPPPFVIVGVGGISSAQDAQLKIDAGADLVQIYTGFIYAGPGLVGRIAAL